MWRKSLVLFFIGVLVPAGSVWAQIDPDLVGWWKLDEASGTVFQDSSGNANDGTLAAGSPTPISGVYGGALEFHGLGASGGGGDYINCGSGANLDITTNISIALWIRPDAENPEDSGTETAPMAKAMSGLSPSWSWQVRYGWGSDEPYMCFTFNTSPRAWAYVGQNLEQGEWCHIACSHDGATLKCYLNGEETGSVTMGAITSSPAPVLIGSDGWGCDWIGAIDDVRIYSRGLTSEEIAGITHEQLELASDPTPADEEADLLGDSVVLGWTPGAYAVTHDVYFGTVRQDVNDASRDNPTDLLISRDQTGTDCPVDGPLDFGTTYYWRVDEVNGAPDHAIFKGKVWSFTTELFAYPVENIVATSNGTSNAGQGPDRTIDGSGMNAAGEHSTADDTTWLAEPVDDQPIWIQYDFSRPCKLHEMRVWNYNHDYEWILGFGCKDVAVEYSVDGVDWTVLGDYEFAQAPSTGGYTPNTTIGFGDMTVMAVRLTPHTAWVDAAKRGLSEVQFLEIPIYPSRPQPWDGQAEVATDTALSWRPGRGAASHEIHLGTDPNALTMIDTTDQSSYPADIDLDATYCWQVVEIGDDGSAWAGDLWSFSTQENLEIEGFEDYDDDVDAETTIWHAWVDGLEDGANGGSMVGNDPSPFAEMTIVHSGKQSMPMYYDNANASDISETDRTFSPAQDWTASGIQSLSLWFHGATGNTGQLYAKINNTKVTYDGEADAIAKQAWQPWNIDLTAIGGLSSVTTLSIGIEGTGAGVLYVDDIRLYAKPTEIITPTQPNSGNLVGSWGFDGDLTDGSGNGHNGTIIGTTVAFANDPDRGQVLSLPGGDDIYVSIGAVGISGVMPRTIACWAKADNTAIPDWTLVFGFTGTDTSEGGNGSHFNIGSLGGPGGVGAHCWGWEETIFTDDEALEWHHYAMSYDGTTIRYYGDGVPMDTDPAKSNVQDLSISADRVHVGSRVTQTSSFPGDVDDAVIYGVQLTDGEVAWIAGRRGAVYKPF